MTRHKYNTSWGAVFQICLSQEKKPDEGNCFWAPRSATRQGTGNGWGPPGSRSPWAHSPGGGWRANRGTSQVPRPAEKGPVEAGPNISIAVSSRMACDQDPGLHWAQTPGMASTSTVTPHFRHVRPVSGLCQLLLLLTMEMKRPRIPEKLLTWPTSWS